jgi:murein DD-endopeptidase MepM/ murein hydrolase activator NlpD
MTPVYICIAAMLALSGTAPGSPAHSGSGPPGRAPDYGSYSWPLRGRVIRGFEPPPSPYEAGHRGIDIAAPFGTDVAASREGTVAFAGWVAGALFISIEHPDGVRTTYSWLSEALVKKGQSVARKQIIGRSGHGHLDVPNPHLHFGARVGRDYIDPMLLLEGADVSDLIHLAPLADGRWVERHEMAPWSAQWPWLRPVAQLIGGIRGPPARTPT